MMKKYSKILQNYLINQIKILKLCSLSWSYSNKWKQLHQCSLKKLTMKVFCLSFPTQYYLKSYNNACTKSPQYHRKPKKLLSWAFLKNLAFLIPASDIIYSLQQPTWMSCTNRKLTINNVQRYHKHFNRVSHASRDNYHTYLRDTDNRGLLFSSFFSSYW